MKKQYETDVALLSVTTTDYQRFAACSGCEFAQFPYEKILPPGEEEDA